MDAVSIKTFFGVHFPHRRTIAEIPNVPDGFIAGYGTYKGAPLPTDVFIWTVEYITKDNRTAVQKGTVTLIR